MDSFKFKNNQRKKIGLEQQVLIERIHAKLNQGGLFEIYQIMESIEKEEEKQVLIKAFIARYKFNFMNHI